MPEPLFMCGVGVAHAAEAAVCEGGVSASVDESRLNQDRLIVHREGDILAFAVADGMGSYASSAIGAEASVKEAMGIMMRTFMGAEGFFKGAAVSVQAAFGSVKNVLTNHEIDTEELSCTLMAGILDTRYGDLVYGFVGDGLLAAQVKGEGVKVLEPAQKGASSYATYPAYASSMWRFGMVKDVEALICATDGVGDALSADGGYLESILEKCAQGGIDQALFDQLFPKDVSLWKHCGLLREVTDDRTIALISTDLEKDADGGSGEAVRAGACEFDEKTDLDDPPSKQGCPVLVWAEDANGQTTAVAEWEACP